MCERRVRRHEEEEDLKAQLVMHVTSKDHRMNRHQLEKWIDIIIDRRKERAGEGTKKTLVTIGNVTHMMQRMRRVSHPHQRVDVLFSTQA